MQKETEGDQAIATQNNNKEREKKEKQLVQSFEVEAIT